MPERFWLNENQPILDEEQEGQINNTLSRKIDSLM